MTGQAFTFRSKLVVQCHSCRHLLMQCKADSWPVNDIHFDVNFMHLSSTGTALCHQSYWSTASHIHRQVVHWLSHAKILLLCNQMNFPGCPVCMTWFREAKQNILSPKALYQPRNNRNLIARSATFSTSMMSCTYQGTMPTIIKTNYGKIYWSLVCYPLHIDRSQSTASLPTKNNFFL